MREQPINSHAFDWEILESSYHLTAAAMRSERAKCSGLSRVIEKAVFGISSVILISKSYFKAID